MRKGELFRQVLSYLAPIHGNVETELNYRNSFELLVAVMLSAQCTDVRVNMVTPALFRAYPTALSMSETSEDELFEYIKSVSYPNSKAKHLLGMAKKLITDYNGEVPSTLEALTSLPGVGRKTANVIMAVAFGKAALAVDTHVFRVSHRLGLVPRTANTPYKVESALRKYIPEKDVAHSHYWLLLHGRYTCIARKPKCEICGLTAVCREYGRRVVKNQHKQEKRAT